MNTHIPRNKRNTSHERVGAWNWTATWAVAHMEFSIRLAVKLCEILQILENQAVGHGFSLILPINCISHFCAAVYPKTGEWNPMNQVPPPRTH